MASSGGWESGVMIFLRIVNLKDFSTNAPHAQKWSCRKWSSEQIEIPDTATRQLLQFILPHLQGMVQNGSLYCLPNKIVEKWYLQRLRLETHPS